MTPLDIHDEWLSLIEVSGPFLATPVLKRIFSTGLPAVEPRIRQYLRQAYDEWCEARDNDDPRFTELHRAWIHEVLARGLEYDESDSGELLLRAERIPSELRVSLPEQGVTLEPDYALVSGGKSQLLVQIYSAGTDLQTALKLDGWSASPAERMERLCRASGCRLGLVTDGERWMLVDAPVGAVSTFASWYARLWGQERLTLQAFLTLLGIRRFFGPDDESLPSMLDESLQHQEEVTDALGEQVRRAVEVLIQALGKEDRERSGALLKGVEPAELYEAGLTIMMRLVFLLSAEERGLLLIGEEAYESNYAISTLRMQLRQETEEVLERRHDAWSRLLAIFRAVYGGIEHEALRLPALGGSLFDPDRFPFLEGRTKGSDWKVDSARPLPIDNRTVLLLLEAIQQYEGRTLSYRALDVEQIGYVYEGLLERTVARTERVTVELSGGKGAKKTLYALEELEALHQRGGKALAEALSGADAVKRGGGAIRKDLERSVDAAQANRLLTACAGDEGLRDRALPFLNLLRTDPWGYPLIYPEGAFIVTTGSDRRETGTHYTPKSLTETIVDETLTPIAYKGPAEGAPREQWVLKPPAELLDLKICDPAMGSGAFLVQVCRWMADRLIEAWSKVEGSGKTVSVDGEILEAPNTKEPLPLDAEARTVIARRLIAERCLYGVDLNPLAVELAKLSIWLVTMAKNRPFGFLDHNLRWGDSLLGIHRLEQLTELSMTPGGKGQQRLFGKNIEKAVQAAIELRQRLREMPIRDIHDVESMARLDIAARRCLEIPQEIADSFVGTVLADGRDHDFLENELNILAILAEQSIHGDPASRTPLLDRASSRLSIDLSMGKRARKPFHWPLEFPEVFEFRKGFDALVSNPPYLGGRKIRGALGGAYLEYLTNNLFPNSSANADLCAFFVRRSAALSSDGSVNGFIATSSISEGDTRTLGLDYLLECGWVLIRGASKFSWPGKASVTVSPVWLYKGEWAGDVLLNGSIVASISPYLTEQTEPELSPCKLKVNYELSYQGSIPLGKGFVIAAEVAEEILSSDRKYEDVIYPYLVGQELNVDPCHESSKWIINFHDWPLDRADAASSYEGPVASDYPLCLDIIREHVYPERTRKKPNGEFALRRPLPQKWWVYGDKRPALYARLSQLKWALAIATQATKYIAFGRVTGRRVYSNAIAIIASDDFSLAGVVSSNLHEVWARRYGSYNLLLIRYSPSDLFDTFPLPRDNVDALRGAGEKYFYTREKIMSSSQVGLTDFYNAIHNPTVVEGDYEGFRKLQVELDTLVARSYGWGDIDLEHGFHMVSYLAGGDQIRFTISEAARLEVLRRLLELNQQRHDEEVVQGIHGRNVPRASTATKRASSTNITAPIQPSLDLECGGTTPINGLIPATAILGFLNAHNGWHAKADVLAATAITDGQWNAAIVDLIASGKVERQGERRGARYRVRRDAVQ